MENTMKLSVKAKLIGGFLLVALIALVIGGVGYWGVRSVKGYFDDVSKYGWLREITSAISRLAYLA